jgi:L-threonylcarbamoyladenylate synthase
VYGLGADADDEQAVRRIFVVKGRPATHPVIVHLGSVAALDEWSSSPSAAARELAAALWPGPLTLLVPRARRVGDVVTGGRPTVGLRVPDHPVALALLTAFGGGVAGPSANRFGQVSPTSAAHVRADLGDEVDVVLDGGPSAVGVESTIVDCTTDPPMVLRPGAVSVEVLETVLGGPVDRVATGPSRAPGMLASHYAPRCRVDVVADGATARARLAELRDQGVVADVLDPAVSATDYARHLYRWLREADEQGLEVLVVVPPADEGVGRAVRDRLAKAAAPRPEAGDAD